MKRSIYAITALVLILGLLSSCRGKTGNEPNLINVNSVSLNQTSVTLPVGESFLLTATLDPKDASDATLYWSSSNENVASVSSEGLVKALAEGSATTTVTTRDGAKTATCLIEVVAKEVEEIAIMTFDKLGTIEIAAYHSGRKESVWVDLDNDNVKDEGEVFPEGISSYQKIAIKSKKDNCHPW